MTEHQVGGEANTGATAPEADEPISTVEKKANKPNRSQVGKKTSSAQAKYPRHSLEKALRIPKAMYAQNAGREASRDEAVRFAGGSKVNGPWNVEISSGQKYGLLESNSGTLSLTDRARRAVAPQSESDRIAALREAVLDAPDFKDVYAYYRGENLPEAQFYTNALIDRFKVPADKVIEFQQIFEDTLRFAELIDDTGSAPRLVDVGRAGDSGPGGPQATLPRTQGGSVAKVSTPTAKSDTTCFVMQPFAAPLGTYYYSVFKPAIEQAGLVAIRADNEIFATGKIIDQIWRGINSASVLLAELTGKNPNVFYELGLAHALSKPVVLVSSNENDIPFDLRHIRVIVYDQADPFWGSKLIDKIADNIKSAIENPEDAIFKMDEAFG